MPHSSLLACPYSRPTYSRVNRRFPNFLPRGYRLELIPYVYPPRVIILNGGYFNANKICQHADDVDAALIQLITENPALLNLTPARFYDSIPRRYKKLISWSQHTFKPRKSRKQPDRRPAAICYLCKKLVKVRLRTSPTRPDPYPAYALHKAANYHLTKRLCIASARRLPESEIYPRHNFVNQTGQGWRIIRKNPHPGYLPPIKGFRKPVW